MDVAAYAAAARWRYLTLTERQRGVLSFCALGGVFAAYYYAPTVVLSTLFASAFVLLAAYRLDVALLWTVFTLPFYRFPKDISPADWPLRYLTDRTATLEFSLSEFAVLACLAALLLREGVILLRERASSAGPSWRTRLAGCSFSLHALAAPLALLLAATVSLAASDYLRVSLREYRVIILEPLLFYALLLYAARRPGVESFLKALVVLGLGVAVFGLFHYAFSGEVEEAEGARRMLAIYHSPNAMGLFLGRVLPIAAVLAIFTPAQRLVSWRAVYAAAALAMVLCLYFTYSRGAWVGVGAALIFVAAVSYSRRAVVWVGAGVAAVLAVVPFLPLDRLISRASTTRRWYLWDSAIHMIRDHPLQGVGLDNFLYQYPRYMNAKAWQEPNISHAHNIVLDFWTRLGILGIIALLWLQLWFWRTGFRLRSLLAGRGRVLALALMASMVDMLVHGIIDNSFFLIDLAMVFWLTYGLLAILERDARLSASASTQASHEGGRA